MKKFHFSLERLRSYRQSLLEQERGALAALFAELRLLDRRRRALAEEEQQATARVLAYRVIPVEELVSLESYRRWVEQEGHRLDTVEQDLRNRIEQRRAALLAARTAVESLTRLRETQLAGWRAELDRETEATVAEMVVARWGRGEPAG